MPQLASDTFRIDRVYRRREIVAKSSSFVERNPGQWLAIVPAKDQRLLPVAFEFYSLKGGAKFKCFGVGRAERFTRNHHQRENENGRSDVR